MPFTPLGHAHVTEEGIQKNQKYNQDNFTKDRPSTVSSASAHQWLWMQWNELLIDFIVHFEQPLYYTLWNGGIL